MLKIALGLLQLLFLLFLLLGRLGVLVFSSNLQSHCDIRHKGATPHCVS